MRLTDRPHRSRRLTPSLVTSHRTRSTRTGRPITRPTVGRNVRYKLSSPNLRGYHAECVNSASKFHDLDAGGKLDEPDLLKLLHDRLVSLRRENSSLPLRLNLCRSEILVADQHSTGCAYHHRPGSCPVRDNSRQVSVRNHLKACGRNAVEGD